MARTSATVTGKSNENSDRSSGKPENKLDLPDNNTSRDAPQLTVTPNPVMNSTCISITIQQQQHASLKIFDTNGEMIKVVADQKFEKGQYKFQWNTEGFSTGLYLLRFDAGSFSETKKLSVIK